MRFLYNLLFPAVFVFFLPSMLYKLKHRPGYKATYGERFGKFSPARARELEKCRGAIWVHSVSVGETMIALAFIREYLARHPGRKFVISTTTTTGQELARGKAPEGVEVIYCPIDFGFAVRRVFDLIGPEMLLILETEIWPNLVWEAKKRGVRLGLINGRMSDHSSRGYCKLKGFFGPLLGAFDFISAQSAADAERFRRVSRRDNVINGGNLKFDQKVPENLPDAELDKYFGSHGRVILAASTHPGEEKLIISSFLELKKSDPSLKLISIPRHAERGNEIAALLADADLSFCQKSRGTFPEAPVEALLADTTGEMLKFMNAADVVIMGKSLAGQDEGHNLIEPALLDKPIVCGAVLRNFRFLLDLLKDADAVALVHSDGELTGVLQRLLDDPSAARELGERAGNAIRRHAGATVRAIELAENSRP